MPRSFLLLSLLLVSTLSLPGQTTAARPPEIVIAEAIDQFLPGMKFNKRLVAGTEADHVLLFQKGKDVLLAGWTEGASKTVGIPASRTPFSLYDSKGNNLGPAQMANNVVYLPLSSQPVFLVSDVPNPMLQIAAAASRVRPNLEAKGPGAVPLSVRFTNVLDKDFLLAVGSGTKMQALRPGETYVINQELDIGRQDQPIVVEIGANGYMQRVSVNVTNPLGIAISPDVGGSLVLSFLNPSGEAFRAKAELRLETDTDTEPLRFDVSMRRGQKTMDFRIPLATDEEIPYAMQVVLLDKLGEGMESRPIVLAESPLTQFISAGDFNGVGMNERTLTEYKAQATTDATLSVSAGAPEVGLPTVRDGGMDLIYQFSKPGGTVAVKPQAEGFRVIEAKPAALGMWVYGDGSGLTPAIVILDNTGRKITCPAQPITWDGWNYVRFDIDESATPPLLLDTLFQLDNGDSPSYGHIYLNDATWIYEVNRLAAVD